MAIITLQGNEIHTKGDLPSVGAKAPDFVLVDKDLNDVSLKQFAGKKKILNIVPSLDTPVCATSTRKFNEAAIDHDQVVVLVISADLPFAMSRFCTTENIENVISLSEMRDRKFSEQYGVQIEDGPLRGITARALLVLDEDNNVLYSELVKEIAQEPNYEEALAALSA